MTKTHTDGAGLRVYPRSTDGPWYGPGYCGVCGTRGDSLIPQAVRWYDPDDGWKMGVLCGDCGEEVREQGPRAEDYAVVTGKVILQAERIDVNVSHGDEDSAYSDQ